MYFKKIKLENFGPFTKQEITFRPKGLNIIYGQNCSGKTQLAGAILAAIVGRPALQVRNEGSLPSVLELDIQEGKHNEKIKLSINADAAGAKRTNQIIESNSLSGRNNRLSLEIMATLSGTDTPIIFLSGPNNTISLTLEEVSAYEEIADKNKSTLQDGNKYFPNGLLTSSVRSSGENTVALLIKVLVERWHSKKKLPLIIDSDGFYSLDLQKLNFCARLVYLISEKVQVILFTSMPDIQRDLVVTTLEPINHQIINAVYYNDFFSRPLQRNQRKHKGFVLGERLARQENRTCEYKEVKGLNPLSSIKSLADQYVVAFLNAGTPQKGSIYWGVNDSENKVVGVKLTARECDELRRVVTEKLHQITPPIAPTAYKIELHKVSDGVKLLEDTYVVEIFVPASRRTLLFATSSQEVYIKTDAGKKKLTIQDIQYELLDRVGVDPY